MKDLKSFIESGILEFYALGNSTLQEKRVVEKVAGSFMEVQVELLSIDETLEKYAIAHGVAPGRVAKPFLMATIDYSERIKNGEQPAFLPELNSASTIADYSKWLNRSEMVLPASFDDLHVKIIGYTPIAVTAIVWIKDNTPQEVHDNEYERFLVVEGACEITVGKDVYPLFPGDYFSIPLHKIHQVIVTSSIACKVILQRIAA